MTTSSTGLNWIANYIWGIADDVLRDLYVRGKYRDVILPMTVLRRLDAVLEGSKRAVLDMKATLDAADVVEQDAALRQAAGQAFYNTSKFTLRDLRARASRQQLKADFEAYLDGFSPNVQDILENFEFRNQIPRLSKADALGTLVEKLTSPDINLSPHPVKNTDGSVRHPGLDNHGMGSIFEELVRRFNEENNEEAGEHWTPRDAVRLMAKLVFLPVAEKIKSGTYLLYDGACGTGGMLTVAEETLRQLAAEHGKDVSTHLYGQEINAETYAICKADLLLKGEGEAADNIVGGPEHSTLANDAFPSREFDFMLSNPPYGKSWKTDLERMGGKKDMRDPALPHRARRRPRVLPGHALQRRPDALPRQQALQDEAGHRARQPYRRGAQRQLAVHRGCRSGREQHPPLDHRERLAGSDRRAAAQHVLQHRHRHLRMGADQPQAGASPGQGAADRRDQVVPAATQESRQEELRARRGRHRPHLRHLPGFRRDRAEQDLRQRGVRLLEGDGRTSAAYRGRRPEPRLQARRDQGSEGERRAQRGRRRRSSGRYTSAARTLDPLRGLFAATVNGRSAVVEYEPDTDLRDTEQIPLQEEGGIEAFLRREVLPYAADAWYQPDSVKIGYEISFTRYFYKPQADAAAGGDPGRHPGAGEGNGGAAGGDSGSRTLMATQRYSVTPHPIDTLLTWVKSGEIAIPEIQRPFVWDATKVRNLLDSLYQGYPVGYLISWRNPTIRLKDGTPSAGKRILIDGQQRVTALMAALLGHEVLTKDYRTVRIRIAFHPIEGPLRGK